MKLKYLFSIVLFAFLFHSCAKNEEPTNADVIGSWEFMEVSLDDDKYTEWPFEETVVTFRKDGSYTQYGIIGRETGTWILSKKTIIVYVRGREYARFLINDWNSSKLSVLIYDLESTDVLWVKCVKFAD